MSDSISSRRYRVPLVKVPYMVLRAQEELNQRIDEMTLFPGMKERSSGSREDSLRRILTSNCGRMFRSSCGPRRWSLRLHPRRQNFFGKNWALFHLLKKNDLRGMRCSTSATRSGTSRLTRGWAFRSSPSLRPPPPHLLSEEAPTYLVDAASRS